MSTRSHRRYLGWAWVLLAAIRVMLWILAYPRVLALTGRAARVRPLRAVSSARTPARAIERAARFVPAATCLVQALAGRILLARLGFESRVCFGVRREGSALEAHGWLECDGEVVIGDDSRQGFTPLDPAPR